MGPGPGFVYTQDDSDDSDYGEGASAAKNGKRKRPSAKNKQRGGNDRRTKQSKQPTSQCSEDDAEWNKNTNKKANRGGNQNWKTTMMLTKKKNWVMLC